MSLELFQYEGQAFHPVMKSHVEACFPVTWQWQEESICATTQDVVSAEDAEEHLRAISQKLPLVQLVLACDEHDWRMYAWGGEVQIAYAELVYPGPEWHKLRQRGKSLMERVRDDILARQSTAQIILEDAEQRKSNINKTIASAQDTIEACTALLGE